LHITLADHPPSRNHWLLIGGNRAVRGPPRPLTPGEYAPPSFDVALPRTVTHRFLPADYPLYGAAIRALPAGLLLLAVRRRLPHGSWWWKSLVLGALNTGAFFALVYLAAQTLPTSIASTIMAISPVVMMLLAWSALAERPLAAQMVGAGVGIGGVFLMLFDGAVAINAYGVLASVAAMAMSSFGYVLAKKWSADIDVFLLTSWQLIAGGLTLTPARADRDASRSHPGAPLHDRGPVEPVPECR
jgi:probable blue pigment (indigoidine) exporter